MENTEKNLYLGEEITKKILNEINPIFNSWNDRDDEHRKSRIDHLYYNFSKSGIKYLQKIYKDIQNKFDKANELKNSIPSFDELYGDKKDKKALEYKLHHLYMWIRDLSFFYSLCYFTNAIHKHALKNEMKELEEHITDCISVLYEKKHLCNSETTVYNSKTKKYERKNFMERLFIFMEKEYKEINIYESSYYSELYILSEYKNNHKKFLENAKKLRAYCAMHSAKKAWKNINTFVICYYYKYSLENHAELAYTNKTPEDREPKKITHFHNTLVNKYNFEIHEIIHNSIIPKIILTNIENIEELIKWIQFDSIVNKNTPKLKIAFKWIFQNKKPLKYNAYEMFKELKDEYGDVITERPAIALVMYELMKKMTYNEFSDIFPKVLDTRHKRLAKENYEKYIGDYLKSSNPENYSEIKISEKFNVNRKIKDECKVLQSMMFFMIWDIMASLQGEQNYSLYKEDAQIPKEKKDNSFNSHPITKRTIISKIINSIMPVIEEKQTWVSNYGKNSFDKEKQVFTFEKEEERKLIEFSRAFIHQMEDKNYIHNHGISYTGADGEEYKDYEGRRLYDKFDPSKAISRYKPFEWYTSQCQEKLLNDLAKDFKLNVKGSYLDFDKTVLLLEELKSFVNKFPVEDEYNELITRLETLSKQKEFTETLSWNYLKKIYFILDNYEEIKAGDLQKEWFEFYKLDINHNQYKHKELIRKTYKALKRFSKLDELYDFLIQFDAKANYTDLAAYLKDLQFISLSDSEFKKKLYKSEEITKYIYDISKKHKEIKEDLLYHLKRKHVWNDKEFKNILASWNKKEIEDRISSSKIAQEYISQFDEVEKEAATNNLISLSITYRKTFEEALLKNNLEDFNKYINRLIYIGTNENLCFEWNSLKKILFLLENSTKESAKNLINKLLELQKLDLNSKTNQKRYYKLLKEVYNIIKHYPAILKDIRNNISKTEIKNQYKAILKKLENLNSQEKIKEKLSWEDMKLIHLILEKYISYNPNTIKHEWNNLPYEKDKIKEYLKNCSLEYKDLLENTLNIVKSYSAKEIKDLVLRQIEKVQDECKKHKIKVKPTTSLFDFNNSKKEYSDDLMKKIYNCLSNFQPENDSKLKENCEEWKRKLDNLFYQLEGTNIKICEREKARDIIQILYPVLKNSKVAKNKKSLIQKLHKIYAIDNPFAYANIHISADNIENASNLLYNISHYIKKEKAYGIRQINFIKEKKLNVLSTQEERPKQINDKGKEYPVPFSFYEACELADSLKKMRKENLSKEEINKNLKPFMSDKTFELTNKLIENRKIWKKLDRGFEIPEFRQTLKPFISLYHCFDEVGEAILSRSITCKFNDESDTLYNWKKVNDYPDANACNMKAVYFTRLRNSEEHYALHGSIKNLIEEKYWYNLLWAFIDIYKYLGKEETWYGNDTKIPAFGRFYYRCSELMLNFIAKEIQDLSKILCNKIKPDHLNNEDLNFWNRTTEDIKEFMESIKTIETKDLNYRDEYFADNLFIERVQTVLGFMYCSNGLNIPSDILSYERTTNKTIPLDEDFLDFYRVPTSLYLIYLTMALTEENIAELKAMY